MADDPVLLITGASSGIGEATARRAARAGYRLALGARREDALRELAAELGGGERVLARACDVTEWDQVRAFAEAAIERLGRIDAVLANAGHGAARGFTEDSPERWRSMILTNVYGMALTIRATLPHLLERGDGHVVLTSSVTARRLLPGSLYSATKWAAGAIGEALRQEIRAMHGNDAIRVTVIEPGRVETPFFEQIEESETAARAYTPSPGRPLAPEDVAEAVLYALRQPAHVEVGEILIRPASQAH
jgi:NADP-dependent 3-hydroxy acid dehydrogenase YdfG